MGLCEMAGCLGGVSRLSFYDPALADPEEGTKHMAVPRLASRFRSV